MSRSPARVRALLDGVRRHPLVAVAFGAAVLAVLHLVWVAQHRPLGAFDVDEVAYLRESLIMHRSIDPLRPGSLIAAVFAQDKGPVTFLVAAAAMVPGSRSATTAFVAQAIAGVVVAVAVAGIVARLRTNATSVVMSGLVVSALPVVVNANRTFQLALPGSAALCCAVWAVVASDRGRRLLPLLLGGVGIAAALLSRTMMVALVPGVAIGSAAYVRWSRVVARNVAVAALLVAAIAGPWWYDRRAPIWSYLTDAGYGRRSRRYGPTDLLDRARVRWHLLVEDVGLPWLVVAGTIVVVALAVGWSRRRSGDPDERSEQRGHVVVWGTVGVGFAMLLSTSNVGTFFALPLECLMVAGVAALRVPRTVARAAAGATVALAVLTWGLAVADDGGVVPAGDRTTADSLARLVYAGQGERHEDWRSTDADLLSTDLGVRRRAAASWWAANRLVSDTADRFGDWHFVCGSWPLLNGGSIGLAAELATTPIGAPLVWLPADASSASIERALADVPDDRAGVLIIVRTPSPRFVGEGPPIACAAAAAASEWETRATIDLPDGGAVDVLTPDP